MSLRASSGVAGFATVAFFLFGDHRCETQITWYCIFFGFGAVGRSCDDRNCRNIWVSGVSTARPTNSWVLEFQTLFSWVSNFVLLTLNSKAKKNKRATLVVEQRKAYLNVSRIFLSNTSLLASVSSITTLHEGDKEGINQQFFFRIWKSYSIRIRFQDWGCVILREIDFLFKFCRSIPFLPQILSIDTFFTPIVEGTSTYWKIDMRKFESSQKGESKAHFGWFLESSKLAAYNRCLDVVKNRSESGSNCLRHASSLDTSNSAIDRSQVRLNDARSDTQSWSMRCCRRRPALALLWFLNSLCSVFGTGLLFSARDSLVRRNCAGRVGRCCCHGACNTLQAQHGVGWLWCILARSLMFQVLKICIYRWIINRPVVVHSSYVSDCSCQPFLALSVGSGDWSLFQCTIWNPINPLWSCVVYTFEVVKDVARQFLALLKKGR